MDNRNALTSTAMLSAIWDKQHKDTLELMIPFIIYSIGKSTSPGNKVEVEPVAKQLAEDFGFSEIPYSVVDKVFRRLARREILRKENREFFLQGDIKQEYSRIDSQLKDVKQQTEEVITSLTEYLNRNRDRMLTKDTTREEGREHFVKFLKYNGYFIYAEVQKLKEISVRENVMFYKIAQFILNEYKNKTEVFTYIDNIARGLLLSRVIYGYEDIKYSAKFKNVCIYLDTTLLLRIFGFKVEAENITAKQLIKILKDNNISLKCFRHNYLEVEGILEAYRHGLLNPAKLSGQTLEYFDENDYSPDDMERVSNNLEGYFQKYEIEIIDAPTLSSDNSGTISEDDFVKSIGEGELTKHLSATIVYRNEDALNNDVRSIASVFILRSGEKFRKIEECKALFVTTNSNLVNAVEGFVENSKGFVPLLMSDLELTTLLWIKNHKRFSDFPTLKLIEAAHIALEPTEEIRLAFIKKVDQMSNEPEMTEEYAAECRRMIYRAKEKEKIMALIDGSPENIANIRFSDLDKIIKERVNKKMYDENLALKQNHESLKEHLITEADEKAEKAGEFVKTCLKGIHCLLIIALIAISIKNPFNQFQGSGYSFLSLISLIFVIVGAIDMMVPRMRFLNRVIEILANKRRLQVRKKEDIRISKLLDL